MKPTIKKLVSLLAVAALLLVFGLFAVASGEDAQDQDQGVGAVTQGNGNNAQNGGSVQPAQKNNVLGDYEIVIKSCRLSTNYEKKPVAIVTYVFTNNGEDPKAFNFAVEAAVYQNGVGLNETYSADGYSYDNQSKEIKKGASLEVEVAYVLNDTTTDLEVEVSEWLSYSDKKVTKVFQLSE